jgi:enoyl-CoA hydratase/carnithine racemase
MYRGVSLALQEAAQDSNTHITALTGTGDYYSSGNDLSSMTAMTVGDEDGIMAEIKKASALIR